MLTRKDSNCGEMTADGKQIVSVIQHDFPSVSSAHLSRADFAIRGSPYRCPKGSRNIDAGVERALSVDRVFAFAEARCHAALERPERRSVGQQCPVAREARRETAFQRARNLA